MNFLALAKRLRQECGISGTGPTAVLSQVGEMQRVVDWTATVWVEIQNRHPNWRWMRSQWSLLTASSDDTYAFGDCTDAGVAITRFKRWWPFDELGYANVTIRLESAGVGTQRWLPYLPWPNFRAIYRIGVQNPGPPAHFTIDPQNRLVFGPVPNDIFVVEGEYQRGAQNLAIDEDVPEMPDDYHLLIVYQGMRKVGRFDAAAEVFSGGLEEGARLMRQLEINQLPPMPIAEPLA